VRRGLSEANFRPMRFTGLITSRATPGAEHLLLRLQSATHGDGHTIASSMSPYLFLFPPPNVWTTLMAGAFVTVKSLAIGIGVFEFLKSGLL
jgi:hypothetical protein